MVNATQRGINYRVEGKGVQWTNLLDMEPDLVSLICGVRAAKIELLTVDLTFEHLRQNKTLPVRWTFNTDLESIPITDEAITLGDSFAEWLNDLFQRPVVTSWALSDWTELFHWSVRLTLSQTYRIYLQT